MRAALLLVLGALAGCSSNWSTDDLVFASVLPWTSDLVLPIPAGAAAQPQAGAPAVGAPSRAWAQSREAVGHFNALLIQVLGFVDQVRLVAPSARTAETRTWGPFPDGNNAGREVQLRVTQTGPQVFEWTIESRATDGEFLRIIAGDVTATEGARRGSGRFEVFVKDFRDVVSVSDAVARLDAIAVSYGTAVSPTSVRMSLSERPDGGSLLSPLGYTTARAASGAGSIVFAAPFDDAGIQVLWRARWSAAGAGRANGEVDGGTVAECWGGDGNVTHFAQAWDGVMSGGDPASCVVVEGL